MNRKKTIKQFPKICFLIALLAALIMVLSISGCVPSAKQPVTPPLSMDLAGLKAGDLFSFGSYEQDNDVENGAEPIEWQVLAVEDGRALVISRYALDAKPYNESFINVTWSRSTLRSWLNGEFYNNAFDNAEKTNIAEVTNSNPSNVCSRARGGFSTKDRIFLLNFDEANKYFPSDEVRQCEATPYAKAHGAYIGENENSWWWLRSPGRTGSAAAIVLYGGYVSNLGYAVNDPYNVVRPAFWLSL